MKFNAKHHAFGWVGQLLSDESAKKYAPVVGDDSPLATFTKNFLVTADGQAYSISITKVNGSCVGFGAHTDESGQIWLVVPVR